MGRFVKCGRRIVPFSSGFVLSGVIRDTQVHAIGNLAGSQVIDFFHLFDIDGDVFVFFCPIFLGDFPQGIAAVYPNACIVFISRFLRKSFSLCFCVCSEKNSSRDTEDQKEQQESSILFLPAASGAGSGRVVCFGTILFHSGYLASAYAAGIYADPPETPVHCFVRCGIRSFVLFF